MRRTGLNRADHQKTGPGASHPGVAPETHPVMTGLQPTIATGRSVVAQAQSRPPRTWRRSQSGGRPTRRYRTGNPERLPALSSLPPPRALIDMHQMSGPPRGQMRRLRSSLADRRSSGDAEVGQPLSVNAEVGRLGCGGWRAGCWIVPGGVIPPRRVRGRGAEVCAGGWRRDRARVRRGCGPPALMSAVKRHH